MADIDVHKRQRAVECLWVDSMSQNGWRYNHAEDAKDRKSRVCRSIGYVIHEDDEVIALAQSLNKHNEGDVMCIPKVALIARRGVGAKGFDAKKVYPES